MLKTNKNCLNKLLAHQVRIMRSTYQLYLRELDFFITDCLWGAQMWAGTVRRSIYDSDSDFMRKLEALWCFSRLRYTLGLWKLVVYEEATECYLDI